MNHYVTCFKNNTEISSIGELSLSNFVHYYRVANGCGKAFLKGWKNWKNISFYFTVKGLKKLLILPVRKV